MLQAQVATYELEGIEAGRPDVTVVAITGELDLTNAGELAERLEALSDVPPLVVDLNGVAFVDSAALHRLFLLARQRGPQRLAFALDPSSSIAKAVAIVGLGDVVPIAPGPDEAMRALA